MKDSIDKKYYSKQISERFLKAMGEVLRDRSKGKMTMLKFGESVGFDSSNITRLEKNPEVNFVTLEALAKLVHEYNFSPYWLIKGEGEMKSIGKLEEQLVELKERVVGLEYQMTTLEKNIEILSKKSPTKKK
jgi:transcriptional regulator with XRE-family HTH domain